jgi:hypothetical protein
MANRIYIDAVSKPKSHLWGFHAYDDYASCCAFNWEELPEDNLEWLYLILTSEWGCPQEFKEMMEFACESEKGIHIRDCYYEWEEIESIYNKAKASNNT